jgi:ABC-type amino acid transport substrate-binding protein
MSSVLRGAWPALVGAVGGMLAGPVAAVPASAVPDGGAGLVRFAPERDYGPFVYQDTDGRLAGLSMDILALVQQRAGLNLQTLPAAALKDQLRLLREGRADLVSSLRPTPERGAYLAFSLPYVSVPAIVVGRARDAPSAPVASTALAALAGRAVAVGEGYAVEAFVRERYPGVRWQPVPDDVQALRGVVEGRYEAAVVDAASASFVVRRHRLDGLERLGDVGFEYTLSFAVRRERADLLPRIDDAIRAIPKAELQAVHDRWMGPLDDPSPGTRNPVALRIGLGAMLLGALAALALWWAGARRRA